jgi:hypothetical protein
MLFTNASLTPYSPDQAKWMAEYYDRARLAYIPVFMRSPSRSNLSPNILERVFREKIEYEVIHHPYFDDPSFSPNPVESLYHIKRHAAEALAEACCQVRDLVADYCGVRHHLDHYGPFSLLYLRFVEAGIKYPPEPHSIFHRDDFLCVYPDFESMVGHIQKAQLWGIFMMVSLHCLALYDGISPYDVRLMLPNLPINHLLKAREALYAKEVREYNQMNLAEWGGMYTPTTPYLGTDAILLAPGPMPELDPSPPASPSPSYASSPSSSPGCFLATPEDVQDDFEVKVEQETHLAIEEYIPL